MTTDAIAAAPVQAGPAAAAQVQSREYATSNATRLLCAGAYLDPGYRKAVYRELVSNRWRMVVPAYGYDTVAVLGHVLAAMRLQRTQRTVLFVGVVLVVLSFPFGGAGIVITLPLFLWAAWAAAFLRRIATLQTLTTRLNRTGPGDASFDGAYPEDARILTPALVAKIDEEQSGGQGVIYYGGYEPFVGAGIPQRKWRTTELLLEAPPNPLADAAQVLAGKKSGTGDAPERKRSGEGIYTFTVEEITAYVEQRLIADLRDRAPAAGRVTLLAVERRKYGKASWTVDKQVLDKIKAEQATAEPHWDEDYEAKREYLCIRIGAWGQEIVTSMFVGFDIKGNTLHKEFATYALGPIKGEFHLVDRLPDRLGGGLLVKLAFDALLAAPRRLLRRAKKSTAVLLAAAREARVPAADDASDLRLGRHARVVVDRGAFVSIREMAMADDFHHYFQETDSAKYSQIVERQLFRIVEDFLVEHNVDLADHRRNQTNILNNQDFGSNNNFGSGNNFTQTGDNNVSGDSPLGAFALGAGALAAAANLTGATSS